MYSQRRLGLMVGLLTIAAGCPNDEVRVEDAGDGGSTDGSDEAAAPTTDDTEDGSDSTTAGNEDESESESETGDGPQWSPLTVEDELMVEPVPVLGPTQGRRPAVAFGSDQFLAVWEDYRTRRSILYGGRMAADGTTLDPLGFPILDTSTQPHVLDDIYGEYKPVVASDGTDFLVVTPYGGQLLGVRVSATGEVLDPSGFVIAESGFPFFAPALVFDGEQYMVAWWDEGIYRARVQSDGTVLDPGGVLAYSADDETRVSLSFDGANYLLGWTDGWFPADIVAGRMAPDGTPIDQVPILIQALDGGSILSPAGGFDGTNHVLAWITSIEGDMENPGDAFGVMATRVTPDGTVLDPDGILMAEDVWADSGMHRLELAAGSGRSLVAWSMDSADASVGLHVRAARITTDGTTSAYPLDTFTEHGLEATLAVHPNGALLLWRAGLELDGDYPAITGSRLDDADVPVPDGEVAPAWIASRQDVQGIASDGQNFFVVWTDTRNPTAEGDATYGFGKVLYGARVGSLGELLDPEPILLGNDRAGMVDVVFDGANYVVTRAHGFWSGSIEAVRVSPAGEVLDMTPISTGLHADNTYALASASDDTHTLVLGLATLDVNLAGVRLNHDGELVGEFVPILEDSEGYAVQASVSVDGVGYLVVWREVDEVRGQRITLAGELAGQSFSILDEGASHVTSAAGGGWHLVVWVESSGIWATRVSPGGQVLDPGGVLVAALEPEFTTCEWGELELTHGACTSVAFDGENFLVAWRAPSMLGDWTSLDLHAVRVSPDGDVSAIVELSQGPDAEGPPFLAGTDGRVLAAYSRFVPGEPYDTRRTMARLLVP